MNVTSSKTGGGGPQGQLSGLSGGFATFITNICRVLMVFLVQRHLFCGIFRSPSEPSCISISLDTSSLPARNGEVGGLGVVYRLINRLESGDHQVPLLNSRFSAIVLRCASRWVSGSIMMGHPDNRSHFLYKLLLGPAF